MNVVYFSVTGQVRRFVAQCCFPAFEISPVDEPLQMRQAYVLILPSYEAPYMTAVEEFLEDPENRRHLSAVAGSGNRNFGEDYMMTAKAYARAYDVPLIYEFEHCGTQRDVALFEEEVSHYANTNLAKESERYSVL